MRFWPTRSGSSKLAAFLVLTVLVITGWTYALNININSNSRIEYGQGLSLTTTCDSYLTVKIVPELDSSDNLYYVKNLILGDISTKLHSKRVTLTLRNDSNGENLTGNNLYFDIDSTGITFTSPLQHTDSINYSSNSTYGANEIGTSSITFLDIRNSNGSKILANDVSRVLIETSGGGGCVAPTCATVSSLCGIGSIGPGGGVVFYVSTTTFTEPVTGRTFKYIEAAPSYWISAVKDPKARLCTDNNNVSVALPYEVGNAVSNTNMYLTETDCRGLSGSSSTPAGLEKIVSTIRNYDNPFIVGTSDVGTWNLPTLYEMIELCKVARFGSSASSKNLCSDSGASLDTVNWANDLYYVTSSKRSGGGWSSYVSLLDGTFNNTTAVQTTIGYFRPIRYFN